MQRKEIELIIQVCKKYDINEAMFNDLIKTEKEYANRNMARRAGIYNRLNEIIDSYL